jgi:uncharacterized protein YcbK (DUF882 family)
MPGAPGRAPLSPPPKPPAAHELRRSQKEMARSRPEPWRIVIARDPRRPVRTIAIPAALPMMALGLLGLLVVVALVLVVVAAIMRHSMGQLEGKVSAMSEAADRFARHPLPAADHGEAAGAPGPDDLPQRAQVLPARAVPPERQARFQVELVNTGEQAEVVLDLSTGESEEHSYRKLRHLMRCQRTGAETPIDPRLIELLHAIALRTKAKILLVSGFRAPMFSTAALSFHTRGMAADIRIPGMTALMVRDLVLSMGVKGVGYYPVSQFVHVDVREQKSYWVDSGSAREESESISHNE